MILLFKFIELFFYVGTIIASNEHMAFDFGFETNTIDVNDDAFDVYVLNICSKNGFFSFGINIFNLLPKNNRKFNLKQLCPDNLLRASFIILEFEFPDESCNLFIISHKNRVRLKWKVWDVWYQRSRTSDIILVKLSSSTL